MLSQIVLWANCEDKRFKTQSKLAKTNGKQKYRWHRRSHTAGCVHNDIFSKENKQYLRFEKQTEVTHANSMCARNAGISPEEIRGLEKVL